ASHLITGCARHPAGSDPDQRFHGSDHTDIPPRPRAEERAVARVSKGGLQARSYQRPSFERQRALRGTPPRRRDGDPSPCILRMRSAVALRLFRCGRYGNLSTKLRRTGPAFGDRWIAGSTPGNDPANLEEPRKGLSTRIP